jgi:hypothetical protein
MISTCRRVDCLIFFQLLFVSAAHRANAQTELRKQQTDDEGEKDIQLIEERLESLH